MKIEIEGESADERSMFRLTLNGKLIAEALTAVQTHLLIGEIFEMAVLPNKHKRADSQRRDKTWTRSRAA